MLHNQCLNCGLKGYEKHDDFVSSPLGKIEELPSYLKVKIIIMNNNDPINTHCQCLGNDSSRTSFALDSKGQLISKCLFGVFNSPEKRTKTI